MAVLKCRILLKTIPMCFIITLLLIVNAADDCQPSCGSFEITTLFQPNASCDAVGDVGSYPLTIRWDDGSYSAIDFTVTVQLVIGSCCSASNQNITDINEKNCFISYKERDNMKCSHWRLLTKKLCNQMVRISYYVTGVVTSGMFNGEKVILAMTDRDDRQSCNGCQSSVGLSRIAFKNALFLFGTRGVGNWIECTGNGFALFSPAFTGSPQNIYRTYSGVLQCNNCVESC